MLQVRSLTRQYASFIAVNNVSFSIGQGEIVGLLGHNGAGKTTIMKMLSGYLEPDAGEIHIGDKDISAQLKIVQRELGYLPENLPVYPEMIVADYLDYAAQLKGISGAEKTKEIKRVVKATDIGEKLLDPIYTLSRGFKQRVGVAQAILGDPKLLILDEPTNGLDPTQTEHMRTLIRDIAKHATVILSTHIMQEVDALCDRVLILNRGELAVDAKLEEVRVSDRLSLETSLGEQDLKSILQTVKGVSLESLEYEGEEEGVHAYLIGLSGSEEGKQVVSSIAKSVVSRDGALYRIGIEKRDLESLFKEANQQSFAREAVQNAA